MKKEMVEICLKLLKYPARSIYSQDEIDLFYQLLPTVLYPAHDEGNKQARGRKALRAKNRKTLAVSDNTTRFHLIPPDFIGKAKKTIFLELSTPTELLKLKTEYAEQINALMERLSITQYIHFWHSEVRKRTSDPV